MDDSSVENAIEWLAQTILASLLIGSKLVEWIDKVGLARDIEGLKSEVEVVKTMVSSVKERATRSKTVAESLVPLKELMYDADDVVDELDYWRIQQQLEGADEQPQDEISRENADGHGALGGRLRSRVYEHFVIKTWDKEGRREESECKYCHQGFGKKSGTSTFKTHLNRCTKKPASVDQPPSAGDTSANATLVAVSTRDTLSSRKRMRVEESAHGSASNTSPWNKDELSKKIQHITHQLQNVQQNVRGILKILGSGCGPSSTHCQSTASDPSRRTSSLVQRKVYGRTGKVKSIIKFITKHKSATGVTVLPIVGIGGVGKTALAQLVYNYPSVIRKFDHRIWIWVSSNFDELRLTREMLHFVSKERYDGPCSFAQLQEVLKGHIKSKRVLLVLDDVWDDKNDCRWDQLLAPFKSDSNSILVTTRKLSIAKRRGTAETIELDALDEDDFWLLFKECAFGDENYEEQASLSDIGRKIARELKGNPLAAQTAGTLLKDHLTVDHWNNILNTEDWKSLQHCGGIMSALKLSYDELPYPLQQCFSYCAIFPCNYRFLAEEIVRIWISQGFVKCNNSSKRLEEIGRNYLTKLVNLGFFKVIEEDEYETVSKTSYTMCELMHDFAKIASRTECATLDGLRLNEILPTVHHFSVVTSSVYQRDDQTGNICRSEKFEEQLRNIFRSVRKLRTFVLIGQYDSFFFEAFQEVFRKEHNLRVLQMSAAHFDFQSFLCRLGNSTHLRYLRVQEGHAGQGALPHVFSNFFHIQVLDVHLYSDARLASLHTVHLADCGGWRIFPSLEKLPLLTRLNLSNMQNVKEMSVPSLEELVLFQMPDLERCSCTSLEDLKSNLRVLEIQRCPALKLFDLFENRDNYETEHKSWLPSLRKLIIHGCPLQVLIPLPPSATFSELVISRVSTLLSMAGSSMETLKIWQTPFYDISSNEKITLDDKILAFHNLRNIKHLEIFHCTKLQSISFNDFAQLTSLKVLDIRWCGNLSFSDVVPDHTHEDRIHIIYPALPSLQSLYIYQSGITGKWLSLMLLLAPTLMDLKLYFCQKLTLVRIEGDGNIQSNLMSASEASSSGYQDDSSSSSAPDGLCRIPINLASSLKKIIFFGCSDLIFDRSREGFARFTSLEELTVSNCPNLLTSDGPANGRWLLPESLGLLKMSFGYEETLRPCFVGNATCLKRLVVSHSRSLKSLQLQSCTAMENLHIWGCKSLVALEGMQSLGSLRSLFLSGNSSLEYIRLESLVSFAALDGLRSLVNLRHLTLDGSPALAPLATLGENHELIAGISSQRYDLFPRLEKLRIDDVSLLTTSFFKDLACLRSLRVTFKTLPRLTDEQERVLLLLRSLQKLEFILCDNLVDLPAGLHTLPSLKMLRISGSPCISRLPKEGLPPSLEKLDLLGCSDKLLRKCRSLATSKLHINDRYMN